MTRLSPRLVYRVIGHVLVGALAISLPAACDRNAGLQAPTTAPTAAAAADDWHEFEGSWNAVGTRHAIPLGGDRKASIVDLSGTMLLAGAGRPHVGFRAEVIGLNDSEVGLVGRSVWTDENDDQVFSELKGEGTAEKNRVAGTILGGTGRYAGAVGTYEFSWQYVIEAEAGSIQGRAIGLKGRVRAGQPGGGGDAKP